MICLTAIILLIWFRTEAWVEYTQFFHLDFLSSYKDYNEKKSKDITLTYLHYLRMYHDCFFIRLVTCPICLSIWIGIISSLFIGITAVPTVIIGGLLLFVIIDKLLG